MGPDIVQVLRQRLSFSDKNRHQVFLEPEGMDTDEFYANGISNGLPPSIQLEMLQSIPGI